MGNLLFGVASLFFCLCEEGQVECVGGLAVVSRLRFGLWILFQRDDIYLQDR